MATSAAIGITTSVTPRAFAPKVAVAQFVDEFGDAEVLDVLNGLRESNLGE
jgi:hypothetical protein